MNRPFAANGHVLGYRIATPCWRASSLMNEGPQRVRAWLLKQKNSFVCPLIPDILVFKSNSWIHLCGFCSLNVSGTFFGREIDSPAERKPEQNGDFTKSRSFIVQFSTVSKLFFPFRRWFKIVWSPQEKVLLSLLCSKVQWWLALR